MGAGTAPDGTWLATAGGDEPVRIWDPAAGQLEALASGNTSGITDIVFAPDGARLAIASPDSTVRVWDAGCHRRDQRRDAN